MTYSGNIDRDFPVTLVDVIADCVAQKKIPIGREKEITGLSGLLSKRMRVVYEHNEKFGKDLFKLEHSKRGARDKCYMWMEHWADAYLVNPQILSRHS